MNITQVKKFCRYLGIRDVPDRKKGWVQVSCPLAPYTHESGRDTNPSFGINVKPGRTSNAHCFSCGFRGDLFDLVTTLRAYAGKDCKLDLVAARKMAEDDEDEGGMEIAYADDDAAERTNITHYFPEKWLRTFPLCINAEDGMAYLASRDVPRWVTEELLLRFDPTEKRVCFPVRDSEGRLVGLHGRGINKKVKPVYRMYTYPKKNGNNNPLYWYGEDIVDWERPIIVTESVFDFLSVYRCYKNVICPLTAELNKDKINRVRKAVKLILMFDGDKAGRRAAYNMKNQITDVLISEIRLPRGRDPGDLSVSKIKRLIQPHLNNVLTGAA